MSKIEKLFCVDVEYDIFGTQNRGLFHKKPHIVIAHKYCCDKFILCEEDKIKEEIERLIENKHSLNKEEIKEYGKTEIFSYSEDLFACGDMTFNEIKYFEITSLKYREATVKECLIELTPTEYSRIYGGTLKLDEYVKVTDK